MFNNINHKTIQEGAKMLLKTLLNDYLDTAQWVKIFVEGTNTPTYEGRANAIPEGLKILYDQKVVHISVSNSTLIIKINK